MRYTLRLYPRHDLDIYSIINCNKISTIVKEALKAYVEGKPYSWEVTETVTSINKDDIKPICVVFNPKKDFEIIEMLSKVKNGYKNCFIKMILRQYLINPNYDLFFGMEAPKISNDVIRPVIKHKEVKIEPISTAPVLTSVSAPTTPISTVTIPDTPLDVETEGAIDMSSIIMEY